MRGKAGERGGGGVAEAVVATTRDHGEARLKALKPAVAGGVMCAVMTGFENVAGKVGMGVQHGLFGLVFCIARQKEAPV